MGMLTTYIRKIRQKYVLHIEINFGKKNQLIHYCYLPRMGCCIMVWECKGDRLLQKCNSHTKPLFKQLGFLMVEDH